MYDLQFAGANNPLYVIASASEAISNLSSSVGNDEFRLTEVKGDKQPVAIYEIMTPFTNHELQLQKGDTLYLCSDGYEDQFGSPRFSEVEAGQSENKAGGTKYRKFMSKRLKELFVTIADKPMDEQKKILETTFENWKGELEQIDDVTVLGLRI